MLEGLITPDVRRENVSTAVTEKTYLGATGVRDWMNDFFDAFDEGARYEIEEIVAVGDDVVVAVNRFVGRGSRSGMPLVPLCLPSASVPSRPPATVVTVAPVRELIR